jgi:RNA polymerase sigma factor (sigma-70 family)
MRSIEAHIAMPIPRSRRLLALLDDERLVAQLRHGNESAFEVMFDRHHRGLLSFCRHMLGTREEAEDAVQQTFMSAYRDLRSHARPVRLKPWLYAIARNRCLSVLRARREHGSDTVDVMTAGLVEEVENRAELRELLGDIHRLREEQRAALVLSELRGLSHADIAGILSVEPRRVKSLVFHARVSLARSREARELSCREVKEELATARGGALRRSVLRRHLASCPGCRLFRHEVRRQRTQGARAARSKARGVCARATGTPCALRSA